MYLLSALLVIRDVKVNTPLVNYVVLPQYGLGTSDFFDVGFL